MKRLLLSVNPEKNRFRFFVIEMRAREDGRAELRRRWGRVGTEGREGVEVFDDPKAARLAHDALLARRERRGYHVASAAELRQAQRLLAWRRARDRAPRQLAFSNALGF